jgi:outer membrane protein assembly factor BamD (BamD/ComL family)
VSLSLLFVSCGKKMTEQEYFEQAKTYEVNEEFEKAAKAYMNLYKRFPAGEYGDEALFRAAIIQDNQLKKSKLAIETLRRLRRAFPESEYAAQAQFMIGFIYANSLKDYENARKEYQRFLELYPDNELVTSVKWELENMGKDINEIEFLSGGQDSLQSKTQ